MSRGSDTSTSSTPTSGSFDDLTELGEYILDQLGRDRRSDNLLVHWVAHRLAEHMLMAETADDPGKREAARDAAALLIAELWRARDRWPNGWPPDAVREFTEGVKLAAGKSYHEEAGRLPPWLSSIADLEALQWEERRTWLDGALLELGADELRRALEAAPQGAPEPDDLADIRWQLRLHEEAEGRIAAHALDDDDPRRRADRARILGRILQDIAERRIGLIERALKDARRGQRRTPSSRDTRATSPRAGVSQKRSGKVER